MLLFLTGTFGIIFLFLTEYIVYIKELVQSKLIEERYLSSLSAKGIATVVVYLLIRLYVFNESFLNLQGVIPRIIVLQIIFVHIYLVKSMLRLILVLLQKEKDQPTCP